MDHLFLDDERYPADVTWVNIGRGPWTIVRTQRQFENHVIWYGIPPHISFDNDLGDGNGEGIYCAHWLVNRVLDGDAVFPDSFTYSVHSMNGVAADRIRGLLDGFLATHP